MHSKGSRTPGLPRKQERGGTAKVKMLRRTSQQGKSRGSKTDRGNGKGAFPGLLVKRIEECGGCGRSQDRASFLKCSTCKRETCGVCTILRTIEGKQRLACASCGAKAKKEQALKSKAKGPMPVRGPQGITALPLAQLAQREGVAQQTPRLFFYLVEELEKRGGPSKEGLFRISVAGASLATESLALSQCKISTFILGICHLMGL
jgi:hypothetical protein